MQAKWNHLDKSQKEINRWKWEYKTPSGKSYIRNRGWCK